jgi:hypothetical protein
MKLICLMISSLNTTLSLYIENKTKVLIFLSQEMEVDLAPKLRAVLGGDGGAVAVFRLVVLMVRGSWKLLLWQVIFCF